MALFHERTGLEISSVHRELEAAEAKGLIARTHETIRPTPLGQRFLNDLLGLFLPDHNQAVQPMMMPDSARK